jgi:hypothetical protein
MQSENQKSESDQKPRIRWGARSIAEYINSTERKVWYMAERGLLPVTRHGRLIAAREDELDEHFKAANTAASTTEQQHITADTVA